MTLLFERKDVFYTNDSAAIYDRGESEDSWILSNNKINDLKRHPLCVLDFSSEHWGAVTIDLIYQRLTEQNLNFILLSCHPEDHRRLPNLFFFPFWYYQSLQILKSPKPIYHNKKYKWSCLNNIPKNHRVYNYIYSLKKPYFADAWFSMHNICWPVRPDEVELDADLVNEWNNLKKKLPVNASIPYAITHANTNSYIHLVTESLIIPKIFITEKTWKPVAYEQIFLIYGNPGTIGFLRSQGLDVFDDLIDHNYDNEPDWKIRCHLIHQQLEKLLSMDLAQVYADTQHRRQSNRTKFYSGELFKQYSNDIQTYIDEKLS